MLSAKPVDGSLVDFHVLGSLKTNDNFVAAAMTNDIMAVRLLLHFVPVLELPYESPCGKIILQP